MFRNMRWPSGLVDNSVLALLFLLFLLLGSLFPVQYYFHSSDGSSLAHLPLSANATQKSTVKEIVLRRCLPSHLDPGRSEDDMVVVLMTNAEQANRTRTTIESIRNIGKYQGDIVLMHSEDDFPAADALNLLAGLNVTMKEFPRNLDAYIVPPDLPGHGPSGRGYTQETAWIYFMKFNVFDAYFAFWCRVLYIDAGVTVHMDMTNYLRAVYPTAQLYAHSDPFPRFSKLLDSQFTRGKTSPSHPDSFAALSEAYDLRRDFPQSTVLYYNTEFVIQPSVNLPKTFYELQRKYPVGTTLDQPYLALYFAIIRPIWHEFPFAIRGERFFDYCRNRRGFNLPVIMSKKTCG